jgi:hypothetical protein
MSEVIDWKAEYEKAEAKGQALKEHVQDVMIREAVKAEARLFESIDPEVAAKVADLTLVSFDEETGEVFGSREAILDLGARYPALFVPKIKNPPPPKMKNELLDAVQKELGIYGKS